jgi:hypothetical protein
MQASAAHSPPPSCTGVISNHAKELVGGDALELDGGLRSSLAVASLPRKGTVFFLLRLSSGLGEATDQPQ